MSERNVHKKYTKLRNNRFRSFFMQHKVLDILYHSNYSAKVIQTVNRKLRFCLFNHIFFFFLSLNITLYILQKAKQNYAITIRLLKICKNAKASDDKHTLANLLNNRLQLILRDNRGIAQKLVNKLCIQSV